MKIEETENGVWIHVKHPDTGKTVRIYVNTKGSPDGIIIDVYGDDNGDDKCVWTAGLCWNDDLGGDYED